MRQFVLNINSESIKIRFGVICKNTFILKTKHAVKYSFSSPSLLLIYEIKSFFNTVRMANRYAIIPKKKKVL